MGRNPGDGRDGFRRGGPTESDLALRLRKLAGPSRLRLEGEAVRALARYLGLLFRWNDRMNLTALGPDDDGLQRLALEPAEAALRIPEAATRMVDIGSGGGSPAIPIKIVRPDLSVRMVESRTRKAAFLREAVRRLEFAGAVVENCRLDAVADRAVLRETHDVLTVRGVRIDAAAVSSFRRLVRPGGLFLIFCSEGQEKFAWLAGARVERRVPLPGNSGRELAVICRR